MAGLNNLVTETTAANINSFLQHYDIDSALGITLSATLGNLQLELGVRGCPPHYDYNTWSRLATNSWIKSLWEKNQQARDQARGGIQEHPAPMEKYVCIIEALMAAGIQGDQLAERNKCRKQQEAFFLSDITMVND